MSSVQVTLQVVSVTGGKGQYHLLVRVSILNKKKDQFQLDPFFKGPKAKNQFFEIKTAKGVALDYRGIMASRVSPKSSDFIYLQPGGLFDTVFEVTQDCYQFPGRGKYQIRMNAHNHFSNDNVDITSDWIKFKIP